MPGVVHIIDDDEMLRKTLINLCSLEEIDSEAYSGADIFLQQVKINYQPGCLILDLRMPGMNGLELQHKIKDTFSHWPIIFLTGHGQIHTAVEALKKGALEFFEKPIDNDELVSAIQSALKISIGLSLRAEMKSKLTVRELDILDCFEYGMSIKEMANKLSISEKTVDFHRANIKKKINIKQYKMHRL